MAAIMVLAYGALAAFLLCFVRGLTDLRARRFRWAAAELAVAALLAWGLMTPIQTHAEKVVLPVKP